MPTFRYKAVNAAGAVATGELDAANESEIVERLRDQGMLPMQVARATGAAAAGDGRAARIRRRGSAGSPSKRVSRDQLLAITRELATLLQAGLPLDRALEILIGLAVSAPSTALLQQIRDDVRGGKSLSQALDTRRDVFSRFYVNIVRAGEAGGALGVVLTRLADTMERNKELRESVKSALIYPTILIGVAVLSVMVLLVWVVPQFEQTFAQAGKALPLPTQVVIVVGTGLRHWWWAVALAVVAIVWWVRRKLAQPVARLAWDARLLRLPLVGDLVTKVDVARFARTLATLLGNGVTLLAGLGDRQGDRRQRRSRAGARRRRRAPARRQGLRPSARGDRPLSAARGADDHGGRGVRPARGDAGARRRRLRPRSADGGQALPRDPGAGADPLARGVHRRHRVLHTAGRHGHERTCPVTHV